MILPTIRASCGRADALGLVDLLGRNEPELRAAARRRLDEQGVDSLLDDPRVLNALLTDPEVKTRPALVFYVLVRQALLEGGVDDRGLADYVASMVLAFAGGKRAYRPSDDAGEEYRYLVDMVVRMDGGTPGEVFLLQTHMGDFSLWITGLFPDYVEARTRRRGAPSVQYYEKMGSAGYRCAAGSDQARSLGLDAVLSDVADHFSTARVALNRVADRHLWRDAGDPVERLLREVARGG